MASSKSPSASLSTTPARRRTRSGAQKSFAVVLPPDAVVDGVGGQRPNGLPTSIKLDPDGPKGHYSFNFPIQPDDGEKDTLFQIAYHLPYDGKSSFKVAGDSARRQRCRASAQKHDLLPGVQARASRRVPEDPNVQTFVQKNAAPGQDHRVHHLRHGIDSARKSRHARASNQPAWAGRMLRPTPAARRPAVNPAAASASPSIRPTRFRKYKWWILGGLALLLAAGAAFLLRKPVGPPVTAGAAPVDPAPAGYPVSFTPAGKNNALLGVLKDEMFSLESERISGTIDPTEYAEVKAALETVLKRALIKK